MQQAIPNRSWVPISSSSRMDTHRTVDLDRIESSTKSTDRIRTLVSENAVLVVGRRGCFMCHVMNRLLLGHGVKPVVYEVEEENEVGPIEELVGTSTDEQLQFPAVFIGGAFVGGLDRLMAVHISGDLVPILKKAGALWL
ncbi:glutaredoxin-C9-like [Magnolia sinica]|uniref:glutaredoxin-C9-like n=1 Tax=Magnolia sinica TaxID=86752 RepID=UPI0026582163|nr:glutaredoxin-C9-like [Magnolia sinica]